MARLSFSQRVRSPQRRVGTVENLQDGPRRLSRVTGLGAVHPVDHRAGSLADVPAVHQLLAEGRGEGKYVARVQG
ncbi:hypothetical protein [Actinomadura spongiicola]|uniref:hypothetical protein n=1 Tax=Actinomadura spongiicola TaxID=2303421 RepID=UPI001314CDEF|nr:hypothetical protein [Actinomadura spongiicola]